MECPPSRATMNDAPVEPKLLEHVARLKIDGMRLDQYLRQLFGEYSRSTVQRLIEGGGVEVNGKPGKASYKVRHGDRSVEIEAPDLSAHRDRTPVLVDDIASSGRTLVAAAEALGAQGFEKPDCLVIHGLFGPGAWERVAEVAGRVVSTDSVAHPSNGVSLVKLIAAAQVL